MSVIELGTRNVRAGYIGDVVPSYKLRSLWSPQYPKETDFMCLLRSLSPDTGKDLLPLWTLRELESFTEQHVESLLHIQRELLQSYPEDPLMIVVPELWHEQLDVMQCLCQLVLEGGVAPAVYCCRPSVAWTLSHGRSSAVVSDIGFSHVTTAAVLDGQTLRHTVDSVPIGSAAILSQFEAVLRPSLSASLQGPFGHLSTAAQDHLQREICNRVKEKLGFVVSHTLPLHQVPHTPSYRMPDGSLIQLSAEQRSQPFELLFGGEEEQFNLASRIVRVKKRLDPEWQIGSVCHIAAGGCSATPGLLSRLVEELKDKDSSYSRYEQDGAVQAARSSDGAWTGASLAASSSSFFPLWITKAEWDSEGSGLMHRKLFY